MNIELKPEEILVPSPCVSNKIGIIYRIITSAYNRAMKPYGISTIQRSILMLTKFRGPINQKAISTILAMGKSTCSRDIQALITKGLLETTEAEDARNNLISVTPKGLELIEITMPIWQEIHQKSETILGKTSIDELDRIIISLKKYKNLYK